MSEKRIMINLGDPSEFTVGPALSELLKDASLADLQRAEMTAISLREGAFKGWCENLADELNSAMSAHGWEVRLVHLDNDDYLEFIARPEGAESEGESGQD